MSDLMAETFRHLVALVSKKEGHAKLGKGSFTSANFKDTELQNLIGKPDVVTARVRDSLLWRLSLFDCLTCSDGRGPGI